MNELTYINDGHFPRNDRCKVDWENQGLMGGVPELDPSCWGKNSIYFSASSPWCCETSCFRSLHLHASWCYATWCFLHWNTTSLLLRNMMFLAQSLLHGCKKELGCSGRNSRDIQTWNYLRAFVHQWNTEEKSLPMTMTFLLKHNFFFFIKTKKQNFWRFWQTDLHLNTLFTMVATWNGNVSSPKKGKHVRGHRGALYPCCCGCCCCCCCWNMLTCVRTWAHPLDPYQASRNRSPTSNTGV